jgi:hypothetical protein
VRTRIFIAVCLVLIAPVARLAPAQQAKAGPLGVLITPPEGITIPDSLHRALPTGAVARLLQPTQLTPEGEEILVYDTGHKFEPNSHVLVIKRGERVADFSLTKIFEKDDVGDTYALFSAAQFLTREKSNAFIAAFRNIGSGAGSIFVLVAFKGGSYQVAWQYLAQQAQLKVRRDGRLQLWESSADGECTWCPQHYEVTSFGWKNGTASKIGHSSTKQALNPEAISATPIVIEK